MTIKELEKELGVPRATIRFYEKEGLLNPDRTSNSYRKYTEQDVVILKKIIILRKIGISVSDIKNSMNNQIGLQELLKENITKLDEQMKELQGAIKITKIMYDKKEEFNTFDEEYYMYQINEEEQSGNKFLDILRDFAEYEKEVVMSGLDLIDEQGEPRHSNKKDTIIHIISGSMLMGCAYYVLSGRTLISFLWGAFLWVIPNILIRTLLYKPITYLRKKYPNKINYNTEYIISEIISDILCIIIFVCFMYYKYYKAING